jgi:hypothetical protein
LKNDISEACSISCYNQTPKERRYE